MKTTVDIHDDLLDQARKHAEANGRTLRSVIEEGLRLTLSVETPVEPYRLPDLRVGNPYSRDPLEGCSWPQLREEIYDRSGSL